LALENFCKRLELVIVSHLLKSSNTILEPWKLSVIVDNLGLKGTLITLYNENIDNQSLVILRLLLQIADLSCNLIITGKPDFESLGKL